MKKILFYVLITLALSTHAQDTRYHADKNLPFNQKAGEVNPQTGEVTLSYTDVALPGRAGMNFTFGRTWSLSQSAAFHMVYDQDIGNNVISGDTLERQNKMGVGWSTNLPYVYEDKTGVQPVLRLFLGGAAYQIDQASMALEDDSKSNLIGYDLLDKRFYSGVWGGEISYREYYDDFEGTDIPGCSIDINQESEYVLILKDNSRAYFNSQGKIMVQMDKSGLNAIWYFYDDTGVLAHVKDAVGRQIDFTYDGVTGNLNEISWTVNVWTLNESTQARTLETQTRTVSYTYEDATVAYGEIGDLYDAAIRPATPYVLKTVTNPLGLVTEYSYEAGLINFSFDNQGVSTNGHLLLTKVSSNISGNAFSSAVNYEYAMPADGPHSRVFYTGFMEYFKVSRNYQQDKNGRVMKDTYYSYYDNFEDDNQNQYSAHIQLGGTTQVYRYSLEDAASKRDVLEELITRTSDGFLETHQYTYDDQRAMLLDKVFRHRQFVFQEKFEYDIKGNPTSTTNRMGLTTDIGYDSIYSLPITQTQRFLWEGHEVFIHSRTEINSLGQPIAQYLTMDRGEGEREYLMQSMAYDPYGNLVLITDAEGYSTHTVFDTATNSQPVYRYQEVTLDGYGEGQTIADNWQSTPLNNAPARIESRGIFNSDGSVYLMIDQEGYGIESFYDDLGRKVLTVGADLDDDNAQLGSIPYTQADLTSADLGDFHASRLNNPKVRTVIDDLNAYQEIITDLDVDLGYTMKSSTLGDGLGHTLEQSNYDANGAKYGTKTMAYDNLGRMVALTDPDADYSQIRTVTSQTGESFDRTNMTWLVSYDDLGRQTQVRYPLTRHLTDVKTVEYNDANNSVTTTDPEGRVTVQHMDWSGQLVLLEAKGDAFTDSEEQRNFHYVYDALGRKRQFIDPLGEVTRYEFNEMGLMVEQSYGPSGSDILEYDLRGLVISKTDRKDQEIRNSYDEAGRVLISTRYTASNIQEEQVRFSYDRRGLAWRIEGNNLVEHYVFGVKGDVRGLHRFLKDPALRVSLQSILPTTDGAYSYTYEYNDGGMLTSMTYPDGSVTNYDYKNGLGYLAAIKDGSENFAYNFQYNKSGVVTSTDWANGVRQTWAFDQRNRISEIEITRSSGAEILEYLDFELNGVGDIARISNDEYGYNGFGEIASARILKPGYEATEDLVEAGFGSWAESQDFTGKTGTPEYSVDADLNSDNRVSGEDHMEGFLQDQIGAFDQEQFRYDASGNRVYLSQNGSEYRYVLGERNRLLEIHKIAGNQEKLLVSYAYDANGNTIAKTEHIASGELTTSYTYDTLNRLVQSSGPHGTATYTYDNANNRFHKTNTKGENTLYLRHGQILVGMDLEWGGVNDQGLAETAVNRYILSGDFLAGRITAKSLDGVSQAPEKSYYHLDHLNSTKLVTNAAAEIEVRYTYRAFGTQLKKLDEAGEETSDSGKYSYSGKELG
jgi:YD repeat-containing protein